jgi:hypothetical protein
MKKPFCTKQNGQFNRGDCLLAASAPPTSELTPVSSKAPWFSYPVADPAFSRASLDAMVSYHVNAQLSSRLWN